MLNDTAVMSQKAALQVIQQAVGILASWTKADFPFAADSQSEIEYVQTIVEEAQRILAWSKQNPAPHQIVFDQIRLDNGFNIVSTHPPNYRPAWALEVNGSEKTPRIPYTQTQAESEIGFGQLQDKIKQAIAQLEPENLAQLTLFLEKFGSHLSVGESDIALIDQARSTAAVAAALVQNPPNQQLALIAGDLTGVQKFIYTISSDGALKSLRARSFYLELATEEILQQLLDALKLPRTNIIYAGASKFYILAAATSTTKQAVKQIQKRFNQWLFDEFQRKVFLAMDWVEFPASDLQLQPDSQATDTPLARHWRDVSHKLAEQSSRKFEELLDKVLKIRDSYTPCKVCHRDNTTDLQRLTRELDSPLACQTCRDMFDLGSELPGIRAVVRSHYKFTKPEQCRFDIQDSIAFELKATDSLPDSFSYYYLFADLERAKAFSHTDTVFLLNNWTVANYSSAHHSPTLLLLADYAQLTPLPETPGKLGFIRANAMAERSQGIQRVGYLRMDVDRLSQIFANGLGAKQTLPRLASLSRQMTYFFKVYINSLAANRQANLLSIADRVQCLPVKPRQDSWVNERNLLFIYAGGDDLFVSGTWDEIVDFAFDVYQSFRAYTGNHPDITLSAGVYLADVKFPLYQAAALAGELEDQAKENGRDSLAIFGDVFKWEEWLGRGAGEPSLLGVLPLVEALLKQELDANTSQAFVRNLLITAQQQDRMIQAREEQIRQMRQQQPQGSEDSKPITFLKQEQQEIRSYLHLPKIAYTIARLPPKIRDRDDFKPIRTSLKHTTNAPYFRAVATWIELLTRKSNP